MAKGSLAAFETDTICLIKRCGRRSAPSPRWRPCFCCLGRRRLRRRGRRTSPPRSPSPCAPAPRWSTRRLATSVFTSVSRASSTCSRAGWSSALPRRACRVAGWIWAGKYSDCLQPPLRHHAPQHRRQVAHRDARPHVVGEAAELLEHAVRGRSEGAVHGRAREFELFAVRARRRRCHAARRAAARPLARRAAIDRMQTARRSCIVLGRDAVMLLFIARG